LNFPIAPGTRLFCRYPVRRTIDCPSELPVRYVPYSDCDSSLPVTRYPPVERLRCIPDLRLRPGLPTFEPLALRSPYPLRTLLRFLQIIVVTVTVCYALRFSLPRCVTRYVTFPTLPALLTYVTLRYTLPFCRWTLPVTVYRTYRCERY